MRSNETLTLFLKDARELFSSAAFLLVFIATSLLVGSNFFTAVRAFGEASAEGALSAALSPLDGIVVPTLGAYDLVITFLLPFVAIRVIALERQSGAVRLLLQARSAAWKQVAIKGAVLLSAWLILLLPAVGALLLWRTYGGHLHVAETSSVLLGYTLRFALTAAMAMAAAAVVDGAATAAIIVLVATVGTWALDFYATGRGGVLARIARFTPSAVVRFFERGLVDLQIVATVILVVAFFVAAASFFFDLRLARRRALLRSFVALVAVATATTILPRRSVDWSEDRRNSFAPEDERLLARIDQPLVITLRLAAEDPRANDYERNVVSRLRRYVPQLELRYPYEGRTALFDGDPEYGTITYELAGRKHVSRSTTEEIVLDELENLAGMRAPDERTASEYPGYRLRAEPRGVKGIFYLALPLLGLALWSVARRE